MLGLDFSFSRPDPGYIKSQGFDFICRYLSHSPGKNLSRPEADAALAAGISIVLVWETYSNRALSGFAGGREDAGAAYAQAQALGQPLDRPIFFAVDWDASEGEQAAIDDYLRGAASVIGPERVGVYGSYYVVKRCHENGSARWLWQTYAWSGGLVYNPAHLYQYSNGEWGGTVDFNEAKTDDFGQWPFSGTSNHGTSNQGDDDMGLGWRASRMESTDGDGREWDAHFDTSIYKESQVAIIVHAEKDPGIAFPFDHVHATILFDPTHTGTGWREAWQGDIPVGTDFGWPIKDYTGQVRVILDQANAAYCERRELS
ncbi:MAG: DUF1906 domain-containing protein [Actinobacteria bacterium]|nr:DUF1906 domain-containing protein [Actinomycetota bacterium]